MPNYESILYEKQRHGVLVTLNRPEVLNALSPQLRAELHEALEEAKEDPEIRAVVLTGIGRAFSSGANMGGEGGGRETAWPYGLPEGTSLAEQLNARRDNNRNSILGQQVYRWEYPKPIIAAVGGWCLGAGSWLALTSHMTIAAEDAVFAQPEIRHVDASNFIWVLLAGFKNALRYSLTGDHLDAVEALRIGLVNKVVPREDLLDECFNIVERIAHVSPETVKINLHIATLGLEMMGLHKAWVLNTELAAMVQTSKRESFNRHLEEAQKEGGLRAFIQTRDAPFQPEPFGPRSRPQD